jgi:ParB family chromosome partitioning protein
MDMGHARALLALNGASQGQAARRVVEERLSVRETEDLVRKLLEKSAPARKPARASIDPDIRRLQERLSERLGARVHISHNQKGKGKLTIDYNSSEELEGILARIR